MKLKLGKKNGEFYSGIYCGNGGISSLVNCRKGSLWFVLKAFSIRNICKALTKKMYKEDEATLWI